MAKRTENDKCEVCFAADIREKLGIGKTKTYEFLEKVYMQKFPFAYPEEEQEKQREFFDSDICFPNELADDIMQDVMNSRASCGKDN